MLHSVISNHRWPGPVAGGAGPAHNLQDTGWLTVFPRRRQRAVGAAIAAGAAWGTVRHENHENAGTVGAHDIKRWEGNNEINSHALITRASRNTAGPKRDGLFCACNCLTLGI